VHFEILDQILCNILTGWAAKSAARSGHLEKVFGRIGKMENTPFVFFTWKYLNGLVDRRTGAIGTANDEHVIIPMSDVARAADSR
jgi:hypothetical protein